MQVFKSVNDILIKKQEHHRYVSGEFTKKHIFELLLCFSLSYNFVPIA